jgi:hypothetical protein
LKYHFHGQNHCANFNSQTNGTRPSHHNMRSSSQCWCRSISINGQPWLHCSLNHVSCALFHGLWILTKVLSMNPIQLGKYLIWVVYFILFSNVSQQILFLFTTLMRNTTKSASLHNELFDQFHMKTSTWSHYFAWGTKWNSRATTWGSFLMVSRIQCEKFTYIHVLHGSQ